LVEADGTQSLLKKQKNGFLQSETYQRDSEEQFRKSGTNDADQVNAGNQWGRTYSGRIPVSSDVRKV